MLDEIRLLHDYILSFLWISVLGNFIVFPVNVGEMKQNGCTLVQKTSVGCEPGDKTSLVKHTVILDAVNLE